MKKFLLSIYYWFKKPKETNKPIQQIPDKAPEVVVIDPTLPTVVTRDGFIPDISRYEPCDFDSFDGDDLIFKATDGAVWIDPKFGHHMAGCKNKKIGAGAYHFVRVGVDPIVQADHYIRTVGLENLKSMAIDPIIDYETVTNSKVGPLQNEAQMKAYLPKLKIMLRHIIAQTGRKPLFYTYESLLKYLMMDAEFVELTSGLWLAKYSRTVATYFKPWSEPVLYQYSDGEWSANPLWNDNFKGIGRCDANIWWSEYKRLK